MRTRGRRPEAHGLVPSGAVTANISRSAGSRDAPDMPAVGRGAREPATVPAPGPSARHRVSAAIFPIDTVAGENDSFVSVVN